MWVQTIWKHLVLYLPAFLTGTSLCQTKPPSTEYQTLKTICQWQMLLIAALFFNGWDDAGWFILPPQLAHQSGMENLNNWGRLPYDFYWKKYVPMFLDSLFSWNASSWMTVFWTPWPQRVAVFCGLVQCFSTRVLQHVCKCAPEFWTQMCFYSFNSSPQSEILFSTVSTLYWLFLLFLWCCCCLNIFRVYLLWKRHKWKAQWSTETSMNIFYARLDV